jgi:protein-disulfide isomerase
MSRRALAAVIGVAVVVIAVVVTLIALSGSDGPGPGSAAGSSAESTEEGTTQANTLFAGIPQEGNVLGDPDAPVTIEEYVDLQCPFCKQHQLDVQPELIEKLVRTRKARIAFVPLAFLGEDSIAARNVFLRLAQTGHAWEFANLFFWNQGQENSGYVTDAYLRTLVGAIPGTTDADAARGLDPALTQIAAQSDAVGQKVLGGHKAGTPGFTVGPTDGDPLAYRWITIDRTKPPAQELIEAVERERSKVEKASRAQSGPTA